MAATPLAHETGAATPQPPSQIQPQPAPESGPHADMVRLAGLHAEAAMTAHFANLLGRGPLLGAALIAASACVAGFAFGHAPIAEIAAWLLLMLAGCGALAKSYRQAIRAPFELVPLRAFAEDLKAIMLYCGFAWGAGAYLALPADTGLTGILMFSAGAAALFAITLRNKGTAIAFLAPVAGMSAFAAVLRPLQDGALASALVLIGCAAIAGALYAAETLMTRANRTPALNSIAFGRNFTAPQ
ncbi:MAG TPA: hypothetical protein VFI93_14055 [Rhizomicrobium sp.]|nr:hypothetical protein [Rhizomicrobium sp.]